MPCFFIALIVFLFLCVVGLGSMFRSSLGRLGVDCEPETRQECYDILMDRYLGSMDDFPRCTCFVELVRCAGQTLYYYTRLLFAYNALSAEDQKYLASPWALLDLWIKRWTEEIAQPLMMQAALLN